MKQAIREPDPKAFFRQGSAVTVYEFRRLFKPPRRRFYPSAFAKATDGQATLTSPSSLRQGFGGQASGEGEYRRPLQSILPSMASVPSVLSQGSSAYAKATSD